MSAHDERLRAAALDLVAQAQLMLVDAVKAWVVVTVDFESGTATASGPYPEAADALIEAALGDEQVNKDLPDGERGWRSVVVPLYPPNQRPKGTP